LVPSFFEVILDFLKVHFAPPRIPGMSKKLLLQTSPEVLRYFAVSDYERQAFDRIHVASIPRFASPTSLQEVCVKMHHGTAFLPFVSTVNAFRHSS